MKIIGTIETIATGETVRTGTDCDTYDQGLQAMQRTLQEGMHLIRVGSITNRNPPRGPATNTEAPAPAKKRRPG